MVPSLSLRRVAHHSVARLTEVGVAGKSVLAVSGVALPEVIILVECEITSRMGRSAVIFSMHDMS